MVEAFFASLSGGGTEQKTQFRRSRQASDPARQTVCVPWGQQDSGFLIDDFTGPVDIEADDGFCGEHRLRQRPGEALTQAAMHQYVCGVADAWNLIGREQARQVKSLREPAAGDVGLDPLPPMTVANETKVYALVVYLLGCGENELVSLQFREA